MTRKLTLTTKRQAMLPAALCRELDVGPGDTLTLERRELDGEPVWIIRAPKPNWAWAGALRAYAEGRSHDWRRIERSIDEGFPGDHRP
ncbi:MAG: hypothetical protein ACREK1_13195 [Longimicrobiales bacterium]